MKYFDLVCRQCSSLLAVWLVLVSVDVWAINSPVALVIHGGAGTLQREKMTAEQIAAYKNKLTQALRAGHGVLTQGGTSLDAVIASIVVMEDSPLFNAGRGAVMTWSGEHELDASLMSGADLAAGAVAGVKQVKNPIQLAHLVMKNSPHVLLSGVGADEFAHEQGLPSVDNASFTTPERAKALQRAKAKLQHNVAIDSVVAPRKWGTVGAVALDKAGNLAAGTSTGGMTAKRWGRIGDAPLIGAGTYADNRSCAVSATGHGEYFIRYAVASDICARVRYLEQDIHTAGASVIFDELLPAGGTGGVIILDPQGQIATPFNTQGMYRGWIDTQGNLSVEIFKAQAEAAR